MNIRQPDDFSTNHFVAICLSLSFIYIATYKILLIYSHMKLEPVIAHFSYEKRSTRCQFKFNLRRWCLILLNIIYLNWSQLLTFPINHFCHTLSKTKASFTLTIYKIPLNHSRKELQPVIAHFSDEKRSTWCHVKFNLKVWCLILLN